MQIPASDKTAWRARLKKSGYFFGALFLHFILFLMIATWVIYQAQPDKQENTFLRVSTAAPPPPPPPPPTSGGDSSSSLDPTIKVMAPPMVTHVILSSAPSDFTVKSAKITMPSLPSVFSKIPGEGMGGHGGGHGGGTGFGDRNNSGFPELVGYLYDLKQTPSRRPTGMNDPAFGHKVKEFIASNWDESLLTPYYKSRVALNTSSIFIPKLDAADGPKAFGVEREVEPNRYLIWYRVTASPPQDGTYHFVGGADDIIVVRVDGKTVFDGSLDAMWSERSKETTYPLKTGMGSFGVLSVGVPFHASAGKPMKIDVLIGEWPGGISSYFLLIEKEKHTYEKQSNGAPLLPIFQLNSDPLTPKGLFPPFSPTPEPWEGTVDNLTQ